MSIVTALVIFFGSFFAAQAHHTEAPVSTPAAAHQIIEDHRDPILAMDAEATFEDHKFNKIYVDEHGNTFEATYIESDESSDSKWDEFTFESIDFPGTFHHYKYLQTFKG